MRNIFISISITLFLSMGVMAQSDFIMTDYAMRDSALFKVGLWGENIYNSNVFNTSVYLNGVFKNKISRNSFLNMENKAAKKNRAGMYESDRVYTSWRSTFRDSSGNVSLKEKGAIHYFSIGTKRFLNAGFSKDAFLLTGFGNKRFAGSTAEIGDLSIQLLQYTQLQYGQLRKVKNMELGIGLSLTMGNKYNSITTSDAWMYTSDIGDSTSLRLRGSTVETDTSSRLMYDPNGLGSSIDLYLSIPLDLNKNNRYKGSLAFELNDLGFITWSKEMLRSEYDGQFNWAGISSPSVFDITDSIYRSQVPNDVRDEFLNSQEKESFTTFLPARLAVHYTEQFTERLHFRASLDYRFLSSYIPYLSFTQKIRMNDVPKNYNWYVNAFQSVGGYGWAGLGAGIAVEHKQFGVDLGTRHLFAMIIPESLNGFNMRLGFHWNFYSR